MIYRGEFAQGFNARPSSLDRALDAARRAVDLAPTHALGHYALATVHFFRKEMVPFRVEAERALKINPLDASVKAYLGLLIASSGGRAIAKNTLAPQTKITIVISSGMPDQPISSSRLP